MYSIIEEISQYQYDYIMLTLNRLMLDIMDLRLSKGQELLKSTDMTINEISSKVKKGHERSEFSWAHPFERIIFYTSSSIVIILLLPAVNLT